MPTEFQNRIIEYLKTVDNHMASRWEIAQNVFPERWTKRDKKYTRYSGRGALISHIRRAAQTCDQLGRIPAKNQFDDDTIFYHGDA